jgi:hypothetical protein
VNARVARSIAERRAAQRRFEEEETAQAAQKALHAAPTSQAKPSVHRYSAVYRTPGGQPVVFVQAGVNTPPTPRFGGVGARGAADVAWAAYEAVHQGRAGVGSGRPTTWPVEPEHAANKRVVQPPQLLPQQLQQRQRQATMKTLGALGQRGGQGGQGGQGVASSRALPEERLRFIYEADWVGGGGNGGYGDAAKSVGEPKVGYPLQYLLSAQGLLRAATHPATPSSADVGETWATSRQAAPADKAGWRVDDSDVDEAEGNGREDGDNSDDEDQMSHEIQFGFDDNDD